MNTPHSTRREADAWWNAVRGKWSIYYRRCDEDAWDPCADVADWWRSLPDERAVTIYREEAKR